MVSRHMAHRSLGSWLLTPLLAAALALLQACASAPAPGSDAEALAATAPSTDARHRAHIRLELAANYLQMGKPEVALEETAQALAADPGYSEAYQLRGLVYMALQDWTKAQTNLQRALELKPADPDVLHNLGWLHCQRKDYDSADALFQRALATPGYASRVKTWTAQGVCHERAGRFPQARETLLHAYEFDAANPVVGFHLASVMFAQGDAKGAQFYIRRVNNGEFSNAASLWLGIKVERALKDADAMRQLAEQLNRRYPDSREAMALVQGAFDE
ncbi:type IV pilus biogenesis/stability protein PilW [Comamonas flocculans]|uniref:Type IV pilus biogenesis/stability protein PilW n=1 Tax=Comamonas flocculans TaxID=2597701 RepID=A0A5B8RYW1_9BURK|nr:type IV pilus biogenesis/stability protein PilW [Comamonas flocculans]QEA13984.1 type IV pilus biogenesis/stability protein PilW [Comamonas flocculans]